MTAISLIKQSKVANDDRCKILISSLQDTLHGIENKSYGARRERSRSRERHYHRGPPRHYSRQVYPGACFLFKNDKLISIFSENQYQKITKKNLSYWSETQLKILQNLSFQPQFLALKLKLSSNLQKLSFS